jgi:hypothetical protein
MEMRVLFPVDFDLRRLLNKKKCRTIFLYEAGPLTPSSEYLTTGKKISLIDLPSAITLLVHKLAD